MIFTYSPKVQNVYETVGTPDTPSGLQNVQTSQQMLRCMEIKLAYQKQEEADCGSEHDCTPPPIPMRAYSISPTLNSIDNIIEQQDSLSDAIQKNVKQDESTEKIYQPLIPPRRYDDSFEDNSQYQSLSFGKSKESQDEESQV